MEEDIETVDISKYCSVHEIFQVIRFALDCVVIIMITCNVLNSE